MENSLYKFEEILPLINESAFAYTELINNVYAYGIESDGDKYTLGSVETAEEADSIVESLNRKLDEHFNRTEFEEDETALLDGFTFVPSKGMVTILVGTRNRLHIKGAITAQLGIKPRNRILIAFNPIEEAFAIVKPSAKGLTSEMRSASYFLSMKQDVSCSKLFKQFNLSKYEGETFYVDTKSLSGNVVIFRR